MPPDYFDLTRDEQAELLLGAQYRTPWNSRMLEKDIWVVWALDQLFGQPDAPKYAFKGGTSLSKVFKVIHRFSEDVDVTIDPDHPTFIEGLNPTELGVSKTQLKNRGDQARLKLPEYLSDVLKPYFDEAAGRFPLESRPTIEITGAHQDNLRIHYPSVLGASAEPPYIQESVLLEFGARASTEPSVARRVSTYLGDLPELAGQVNLPAADVQVMAVERTFWEKATLVHFENSRNDQESASIRERYARHWYDLHQLSSDQDILNSATSATGVLRQVLHVKNIHYGGKGVSYVDCGAGKLRLVPAVRLREQLARDYSQMITANMFVQEPPAFGDILDNLRSIEHRLNTHFTDNPLKPV